MIVPGVGFFKTRGRRSRLAHPPLRRLHGGVDGETTEGGKNVDGQECFVGGPTSLAGLGMGQVAVADDLVERRLC
jgi:hypothetical protein